MAAQRYWRVSFGSITGAARFAEIEMRVTPGGADQCSGGTAISSTGTAASAFDDSVSTDWISTTNDSACWIGYDFGAGNDKDIVEVVLRPSDTTPPTGCAAFKIESSPDGTTWTNAGVQYSGYTYTLSTELVVPLVTAWQSSQSTLFASAFDEPGQWTQVALKPVVGATMQIRIPVTELGPNGYIPGGNTGVIYGTVLAGADPVPFARVMVYNRGSGELIQKAECNSAGEFSFDGLDPTTPASTDLGKYFVVALDPLGDVLYNALIFDRVVPSPA